MSRAERKIKDAPSIVPAQLTRESEQEQIIFALLSVWKRHEKLKFTDLANYLCKDARYVTDKEFFAILTGCDPISEAGEICQVKSPSGYSKCGLPLDHPGNRHISFEMGLSWEK